MKSVHVNLTGENWEVESDTGTLAQTETREEAMEAAREVARQIGAARIVVHTSDGLIEKEIELLPNVSEK
jgi:hypothetical protein